MGKIAGSVIDINRVEDRLTRWDGAGKNRPKISRQIFFSFSIPAEQEESIKEHFLEQIQIAFQILINQGYSIVAFHSEEKDAEACKSFVDVFKDQAIQYVGGYENSSMINLLSTSEFAIVMDEECLVYALLLDKPFTALFINKDLLEESGLQDLFTDQEGFNAGVLLQKVDYLETNNTKIMDAIVRVFDESNETGELTGGVNAGNEMELYKKQFKENMQALIEQGLLQEAGKMLDEYEKIVSDDIDIYSIKGIIAMMEGDMDGALRIIDKGLKLDSLNAELLYNKAYVLKIQEEYKQSYKFFEQSLVMAKDETLQKEIMTNLNEIKRKCEHADFNGKLTLLFIKKRTKNNIMNYIIDWFQQFGFTILKSFKIDNLIIKRENIRQSIFLYDLNPVEISIEERANFPKIDNKRYLLLDSLQKQMEIEFGIKNLNDYLYLTQNEQEAEYIGKKFFDTEWPGIYKEIIKIENDYKTKYPVIHLFDGFRHRAKTELIQYRDGLAVKKTWKPGNEKYFEREKFACGQLSKTIRLIPPLIESGDNYIIIPYYKDILHNNELAKKKILTTHIGEIASFFKELYEAGYFNPDIHPGQFVFSEKDGLKAIDFEYLQPYKVRPDIFLQSYDIKGYPQEFRGDKPNYVGKNLYKFYNKLWVEYTGYNLEQIADIADKQYTEYDIDINKVLGLINYAKTSGKSYDGSMYGSAYHSMNIKGYYFRGQRECNLRLQRVPYDFSDKVVLDIGCNAGGMLHCLSDKIKMGIGIDYDYRLINAANAIKGINQSDNLSFYRFDLENEDLDLINYYLLIGNRKVDICFLLSVCMWISNWKEVIKYVAAISDNLLFETNGTYVQQKEQIEELQKAYDKLQLIEEESNDDPGQPNRKLILCQNKHTEQITVISNIKDHTVLLKDIIKPEYKVVFQAINQSNMISKICLENGQEIDFLQYLNDYFDFELFRSYLQLLNTKNVEGIITGLSYFEVGINQRLLKMPFVNLAISSQDLFYDFALLKHAIDELNIKSIKKVIIGLSNYSFRYDLSLTQNLNTKNRPRLYYSLVKKLHNYLKSSEVIEHYQLFHDTFKEIFARNYNEKIYNRGEKNFNEIWNRSTSRSFNSLKLENEEKNREIYLAQRWEQSYPDTVKENIAILNSMLQYLTQNNIEIIIVTNPVTKFYKNYFPINCREEFISIISEFQKNFKFVFIDGYNMDDFSEADFYDASHLNPKGAKKFTEILNLSLK